MAIKRNIEIQDHEGNIYNPHTAAKVVFLEDGKNVESQLAKMATEMESVKQSGVNAKSKMVTSINSKKTVPDVTANDTWDIMAQRVSDIKEGSGNAVKADVRRGKTFTNNDGVEYTGELDISADKILKGQNIGGVTGTATNDANASAGDVISGKTAYVNGSKVTGNIEKKIGWQWAEWATIVNGNLFFKSPVGYYSGLDSPNGSLGVYTPAPNVIPENIKSDVDMFGVVGNLKENPYEMGPQISPNFGSYSAGGVCIFSNVHKGSAFYFCSYGAFRDKIYRCNKLGVILETIELYKDNGIFTGATPNYKYNLVCRWNPTSRVLTLNRADNNVILKETNIYRGIGLTTAGAVCTNNIILSSRPGDYSTELEVYNHDSVKLSTNIYTIGTWKGCINFETDTLIALDTTGSNVTGGAVFANNPTIINRLDKALISMMPII